MRDSCFSSYLSPSIIVFQLEIPSISKEVIVKTQLQLGNSNYRKVRMKEKYMSDVYLKSQLLSFADDNREPIHDVTILFHFE